LLSFKICDSKIFFTNCYMHRIVWFMNNFAPRVKFCEILECASLKGNILFLNNLWYLILLFFAFASFPSSFISLTLLILQIIRNIYSIDRDKIRQYTSSNSTMYVNVGSGGGAPTNLRLIPWKISVKDRADEESESRWKLMKLKVQLLLCFQDIRRNNFV